MSLFTTDWTALNKAEDPEDFTFIRKKLDLHFNRKSLPKIYIFILESQKSQSQAEGIVRFMQKEP